MCLHFVRHVKIINKDELRVRRLRGCWSQGLQPSVMRNYDNRMSGICPGILFFPKGGKGKKPNILRLGATSNDTNVMARPQQRRCKIPRRPCEATRTCKRELKQRRFWATLVHRKWTFFILGQIVSIIESFRFGDENDYEYEIWLKVLFAYSLKIDTPESFIVLFSPQKLPLLSLLQEVKPSTGRKTSSIW